MRSGRYILNAAGEPEPCEDLLTWGEWIGTPGNKRIASTDLPDGRWVSTVFLGLDHGWGQGPPVLFETMVFKAGLPGEREAEDVCRRYRTRHDAIVGHEQLVATLANPPDKRPS